MELVKKVKAKAGHGGGQKGMTLVFADPLKLGADILVGIIEKFADVSHTKGPYAAKVLVDWKNGPCGGPVWKPVGNFWTPKVVAWIGAAQFAAQQKPADHVYGGDFVGGEKEAAAAIVEAAKATFPKNAPKKGECP
jgi:hypothetical protein